jgi:predicted metal-binding protein
MKARLALVLLALSCGGCGGELRRLARDIEHLRRVVGALDCGDGAPVRVLTDPRCPNGICGISCAPDRWWRTTPST